MGAVGGTQRGSRAVRIDWEQHTRGVGHLAQQRLGQGRVLVRLLVLAVLPGVRGGHRDNRQPPLRTARLRLVAGEQDLLAQRAEHLDGEGFIGDQEVDTALVAQCRADHRLLVERRDHRTVHRFGQAGLGHEDAMLQQIQRLSHPVAAQFVGVADARP